MIIHLRAVGIRAKVRGFVLLLALGILAVGSSSLEAADPLIYRIPGGGLSPGAIGTSPASACQAYVDSRGASLQAYYGGVFPCVYIQFMAVQGLSCYWDEVVGSACPATIPVPFTGTAGLSGIGILTSAITDNSSDTGVPPPGTCSVGDPVNPGTGNNFISELDYQSGTPHGLRFVRTYNSVQPAPNAAIGRNWRHSYERSIQINDTNDAVSVLRPDDKIFVFRLSGGGWTPNAFITDKLEQLANGWRYTTSDGDLVELYDTSGRLLSIANRSGLTQTLAYSNASTSPTVAPRPGLLVSVSDPFGRSINFTYDAFARITTMADPVGGIYSYAYEATAGNLTSVTYPDTQSPSRFARTYNLDPSVPASVGQVQSVTDENRQQFSTWQYDSLQRVVSSQHAGGANLVTMTYGSNASTVTSNVDAGLNATRNYSFQTIYGVARNTGITGPACPSGGPASQTYDANGNVATRTDWNGNVTVYGYDLTRNLETSRTEAYGTPQARTISTQWDANFRLPVKVAEPLRITSYVYNGEGAACGVGPDGATPVPGVPCSKTIQPTSDTTGSSGFGASSAGTARTWSYTYNANGSVLTMDGPRTDVSDVTTYTYYANNDANLGKRGNVASITNALGQVTQILAYNAHGRPLTIVDPNGLTTNLTYDPRQRLTSRNIGGELTTYSYDGVGQLTKVTLPDSSSISYTYDAAHRLIGMSDNLGNRVVYTLNIAGDRKQEQVFDPTGSLAKTQSRIYDAVNRLAQDIGAQSQTTQYAYDNQGNLTGVTDPLQHLTSKAYDALNRLVQVTDPGPGLTHYAYNGIDQLVAVSDPRNLTTSYNYDGLANLNSQTSPDTGTTQNTYDAAGNLLTQIDAKNQITSYTYDALNRVTSIRFADGSTQSYGYDQGANGLGRLTYFAESNPLAQITIAHDYAYDAHGRVVTENRTINRVNYAFGYGYDSAGRLSGMTYPSGRTVAYGFDPVGRISQVSTTAPANLGGSTQTVASNITYQPFGGVKSYTLGNGRSYVRSYDLDGRIASYTQGPQTFALGYDVAGRIISIADTANTTNPNTYGYDSLDRLTSAATPALTYGYTYDGVGNRTSKTAGTATDTYTYAATGNRLASISGASGRSFSFDANGSTLADGVNQYAYDARGRMASATSTTGTASYQVNALGQRVRKTTAADDRMFLYDLRGRLIAETDPSGGLKREYLYLNDIPLVVFQ
jgi:YD repeat-containing protein